MTDDDWYFISGCFSRLVKQADIFNNAHEGLKVSIESPLVEPLEIGIRK